MSIAVAVRYAPAGRVPLFLAMVSIIRGTTDGALVTRAQAGDREAFAELVGRYQDPIYNLCLRWLRDRALAEELAQDVFLAAYRALDRFRSDSKFSTWLWRIAINHCKNRRRYGQRRAEDRHEPLEGNPRDDGPPRQLESSQAGTDRGVEASEAQAWVSRALNELDEDQRTIVVLRDIEELSYQEIGQAMNLSPGTVKSRLHRARAYLAQVLSQRLGKEDVL